MLVKGFLTHGEHVAKESLSSHFTHHWQQHIYQILFRACTSVHHSSHAPPPPFAGVHRQLVFWVLPVTASISIRFTAWTSIHSVRRTVRGFGTQTHLTVASLYFLSAMFLLEDLLLDLPCAICLPSNSRLACGTHSLWLCFIFRLSKSKDCYSMWAFGPAFGPVNMTIVICT